MATEGSKEEEKLPSDMETMPMSRLPDIWSQHYQQLEKIDELEKRLDEQASRARRRISNLLEQSPTHRRSHLRVFVTHKYEPVHSKWVLVVEGKTLVGLLDHISASKVEQEGAHAVLRSSSDNAVSVAETKSTSATSNGTTVSPSVANSNRVDSNSEGNAPTPVIRSTDRSQYRTVGEKEEDPVEPIYFTHFFDKVQVRFQTIYQPKSPPNPTTTPKKSRSTKRKAIGQEPAAINPRHLKASKPTNVVWTKNNTADAHAFFVEYESNESAIPPPANTKFHSVVATITMHSRRTEDLYKPSPSLAEKFFPKHQYDSSRQQRSTSSAQKRKKTENSMTDYQESPSIALENDIHIPGLLTMNEIIMALFQYVFDNNLQDPADKSLVLCDKVLSNILECETFNFSDLQQLLLTKDLITKVGTEEEPIVLTYIMTEKTTSPQDPNSATIKEAEDDADGTQQQVLSFDMDVSILGLFHYRARELLRRIKRREFEYTSSRTKARYLLVASRANEDIVKSKIEQAVSGRGYSAENVPVFLALAKAAPPHSEARASAQTDAKICSLVERLEECSRGAEAAWDLIDACRGLT